MTMNRDRLVCITLPNWVLFVCITPENKDRITSYNVCYTKLLRNPTKQTAFSQYDRPQARRRYAEIADHLGLTAIGDRTGVKVEKLLTWLEALKAELDIPASIREAGVKEADFLAKVDQLAVEAFDDQCTGANPRYPLIAELKQILLDSYYGRPFVEGNVVENNKEIKKKAETETPKSAAKKEKVDAWFPYDC